MPARLNYSAPKSAFASLISSRRVNRVAQPKKWRRAGRFVTSSGPTVLPMVGGSVIFCEILDYRSPFNGSALSYCGG